MNAQQIKLLLKQHNIAPLKSLGQHFLTNEATVEHIIRIANITKYDTIIEIGAGLGILTQEFLVHAKKVLAVEIDKGFCKILKERFEDSPSVHIVHDNILRYTFHVTRYKLLGNLPYNLASQILDKFLREEKQKPQVMVLMLQREFANRMVAAPPAMNRLALLCQYYGKPEIMLDVPPHHFWPQPKVHSSVVRVEVKPAKELPLTARQEKKMWNIIKQAFSQPRKKLRNSINLTVPTLKDKRPEELFVKDWVTLASPCNV